MMMGSPGTVKDRAPCGAWLNAEGDGNSPNNPNAVRMLKVAHDVNDPSKHFE